jgi:hypothetical protein
MKSLDEQIASVKRELAMRERVYPQWIEAGYTAIRTEAI